MQNLTNMADSLKPSLLDQLREKSQALRAQGEAARKPIEQALKDIDRILITDRELAQRVRELAAEMAACYPDEDTGLILVPILSGSIIFLADLIRQLPIKMRLGLITVSSYAGATTQSRGPALTAPVSS